MELTKLGVEYIGIIISETKLKPQDLINACVSFIVSSHKMAYVELHKRLSDLDTKGVFTVDTQGDYIFDKSSLKELCDNYDNDGDTVEIILEIITEIMEEIAPDGSYCGSTEGDGVCFGYWYCTNEDLEDDINDRNDNNEAPYGQDK